MKTKLVRIYAIDWERLKKIKTKHGFANYADTTNYVLQKFPEMIESPKNIIAGNPAIPVVKQDPLRDFIQLGGERC